MAGAGMLTAAAVRLIRSRPSPAGRRGTGAAGAALVLITAASCLAGGCVARGTSGTVSVWVVGEGRELTADSEPVLENEVYSAARRTIDLTAAINETTAFQLGLRAARPPAGPFNIQISELEGPAGKLDTRAAVTIYRVHFLSVERFGAWYPAHTGRSATVGVFPDILVPWEAPRGGGPIRLDDTRNAIIWVDLYVPPATQPGVYSGRVELYAPPSRSPEFACTLRLTVAPVAIPSERALPVLCRVDPRDLLARHLNWPRLPAGETRILPAEPTHQAAQRLIDATMQLLHDHRTTPLLFASFPKYRPAGPRAVAVEWEPYDQLVAGYLSGESFADKVGLSRWIIPAAIDYPSAERNGGFESPRYARLLAAYLAECSRHFAERGWLERAVFRPLPPTALSPAAIERVRRAAGIVRQSEVRLPMVAHLPARSLRAFGWQDAPTDELSDADIWAPPARWFEPEAMQQQRSAGRQTWFMPDLPPYSPALTAASRATDACLLAWQAFRYGADAIWIEHATEFEGSSAGGAGESAAALIYPGVEYGLVERPLPSIRLKRLRRGLLDYELLRLLERGGKPLLAARTAEQLVRWAFIDACEENLLATRETGWPDDAYALWLARRLLLQELANTFAPSAGGGEQQAANLVDWSSLINQATRVQAEIRGVRLKAVEGGLRAYVYAHVSNATDRVLDGRWQFPALPTGWKAAGQQSVRVVPGGRSAVTIELELSGLTYNPDGVYSFQMLLDSEQYGAFSSAGRLAVATCPFVDQPPAVDGRLDDWLLATSNVAGDFRLVRGGTSPPAGHGSRAPTLPTRVFFCVDRENLYVAVRCGLNRGERPVWQADNTVPLDGAVPWGQDVVEILLDPHNTHEGTGAEIYCIQVKPSGLLLARRGCLTDPPMNRSEVWQSRARVAVSVEDEAWTVELAVPLESFGQAARNRLWGCNVTRLDARRGEYSSWSGARGYAYAPHLLGNLVVLWP